MEYEIRPAKAEDMKKIWEIRNHHSVRIDSTNQEEIPYSSHKKWFIGKYFKDKKNYCFVLEYNKEAIGYCRIDQAENGYMVSIAINPEFQGKGAGSFLLGESLEELKSEKPILAVVKKENIRSLRLFKKNNFEAYKVDDNNFYFKYGGKIMKEKDIRPQELEKKYEKLFNEDLKEFFSAGRKFVKVKCPACSLKKYKMEFSKGGFKFVRCDYCKTLFISPRPGGELLSAYYSRGKSGEYWSKVIFPATEKKRREMIFVPRVELVKALLNKHRLPAPKILLEVGAGWGQFLEVAREKRLAKNYIAVEPSEGCADKLKEKGFRVIKEMIENVKIKEKIDAIACFELIEHLFDPKEFIKSCYRLLAPGGIIILSTPNESGFDLRVLGKLSDNIAGPNHLNYFNRASLEKLLESQGFGIIESLTPGKLDADIVRGKIKKGIIKSSGLPFWWELILEDAEGFNGKLQKFLQDNKLSSNMLMLGRKK